MKKDIQYSVSQLSHLLIALIESLESDVSELKKVKEKKSIKDKKNIIDAINKLVTLLAQLSKLGHDKKEEKILPKEDCKIIDNFLQKYKDNI